MIDFLQCRWSPFIFIFSFENFDQAMQTIISITFAILWHLLEEIVENDTHIELIIQLITNR